MKGDFSKHVLIFKMIILIQNIYFDKSLRDASVNMYQLKTTYQFRRQIAIINPFDKINTLYLLETFQT